MPGHSRSKNGVAFARLCPGHPRLGHDKKDVDGRDKPGHDDLNVSQHTHYTARLSASARSVRSHEKLPSFSGARPKWP